MPIQKLSHASALGGGSNLWIVPSLFSSIWTRKLDWYLNFQISRSKSHKKQKLPDPLIAIIKDNQLPLFPPSPLQDHPSLLIASQTQLPNQFTLELPLTLNMKDWIAAAHQYWQNLGRPSLRIFLPSFLTFEHFAQEWPEKNSNIEITLVSDLTNSSHG